MPTEKQTSPVAAPAIEPAQAAPPRERTRGGKDKGKDKDKDKSAPASRGGAGDATSDAPSIAAHPRAARSVARAKGWAGLVGFVLGGYLSLPTNTLADAGVRALVAGAVGYVAVWAAAVFVWRALIALEIARHRQHRDAAHPPPDAG